MVFLYYLCVFKGYLFKRSSGKKPWRSWSRRWFVLADNRLIYCKRPSPSGSGPSSAAANAQVASELAVPPGVVFEDASLTPLPPVTISNNSSSSSANSLTTHSNTTSGVSVSIEPFSLSDDGLNTATPVATSLFTGQNLLEWTVLEPDIRLCTAKACDSPIGAGALNSSPGEGTTSLGQTTNLGGTGYCSQVRLTSLRVYYPYLDCWYKLYSFDFIFGLKRLYPFPAFI
ncbi:unnamed protein product [Protopolystoma xenopodis]|uniref:PH domain-containing protein n=1 Tax=Protopolystoma xenopodis TaxID=117903 RepID=A0A448WSS2_9PLAT|nr:unnamed protein product [Protopolystoma xenopodis]